jgi:hypothetical protein
MRGRVCRLQLLLVLASAVIFGSESRKTRGHILQVPTATIEVRTKTRSGVFYAVRAEGLQAGQSLELSRLWDIRQTVRALTEDFVRIRNQETTSDDKENFMCAAVTVIVRVCKPVRLV